MKKPSEVMPKAKTSNIRPHGNTLIDPLPQMGQ
jgi:hypothetical protein